MYVHVRVRESVRVRGQLVHVQPAVGAHGRRLRDTERHLVGAGGHARARDLHLRGGVGAGSQAQQLRVLDEEVLWVVGAGLDCVSKTKGRRLVPTVCIVLVYAGVLFRSNFRI